MHRTALLLAISAAFCAVAGCASGSASHSTAAAKHTVTPFSTIAPKPVAKKPAPTVNPLTALSHAFAAANTAQKSVPNPVGSIGAFKGMPNYFPGNPSLQPPVPTPFAKGFRPY